MQNPLLSVLIPTYNRPIVLAQALASTRFLGKDLEIIIGNNGDATSVNDVIANVSLKASIEHIHNPAGSTYPQNLKILVEKARGQWLTILHDDDFFTEESGAMTEVFRNSADVQFIFSDHWVADNSGTILRSKSIASSEQYGRAALEQGPIKNLQILAVNNSICFDCFFMRTDLAKLCYIDTTLKYFADIFLLLQYIAKVSNAIYISDRLFAYRISVSSNTTAGFPQDELLDVLMRSRSFVSDPEARVALDVRIRKQAWNSLKFSMKRLKFRSIPTALKCLLGFS